MRLSDIIGIGTEIASVPKFQFLIRFAPEKEKEKQTNREALIHEHPPDALFFKTAVGD